ncbi:TlpA family protein disulfide reductase [Sorangium sp. So ce1151]|uniref:TlpA family protein disulfide reductase n=1 Tax=Sorangium sp. So ce1151 TaxID=3133332 RepID=UPI003F5EFB05
MKKKRALLPPAHTSEINMTLNPGQPAPPITGTDVNSGLPWSLKDHVGKTVLLAFSGITWCGPCQLEAPELELVWQELQGNPTFHMAIISGSFAGDENGPGLLNAIQKYGVTFPVVPGSSYWSVYDIAGVPTLYCLSWNKQTERHEICCVHVGATDKSGILEFLAQCGFEPRGGRARSRYWAALMVILSGGTGDGGGWGVVDGKVVPIPIWDPLAYLGPAGRDVLVGLAMAEMTGHLADPVLRGRARQVGIDVARASLERLERAPSGHLAATALSPEMQAWGPAEAKAAAMKKSTAE